MLHKYYLEGISNNFNLKFTSNTAGDGCWTIPDVSHKLRDVIDAAMQHNRELAYALDGYKQCLYLEKSENTNKYWNVVIGIWNNKRECDMELCPRRIVRITTREFRELVEDRYSGKLYQVLPLEIWDQDENIRMFY